MATKKKAAAKKAVVTKGQEIVALMLASFKAGRKSFRFFSNDDNALEHFEETGLANILAGAVDVPPKAKDEEPTCSNCGNRVEGTTECKQDHEAKADD